MLSFWWMNPEEFINQLRGYSTNKNKPSKTKRTSKKVRKIKINSYECGDEIEFKPILPGIWIIPEIDYDLGDDCVYVHDMFDVKQIGQVIIDGAIATIFTKAGNNPTVILRCGDKLLRLKLVD